jgi:hypothetical protein
MGPADPSAGITGRELAITFDLAVATLLARQGWSSALAGGELGIPAQALLWAF